MNSSRDVVVVLSADEKFALPLAATVRSVLDHLAADRRLRIYLLDGGIMPDTKQKLLASWPEGRFEITWVNVDPAALAELPISGHVNLMTYYRILISLVLPKYIERVIYLDCDLIVRTDLGRLWDEPLGENLCLAVQDFSTPHLDATAGLPNYPQCAPFVSPHVPVPNFRELGLRPEAPYFNAGVMLIDLAGWRQNDLAMQMLQCLEDNRQHVTWWDQYALNVVLAGRWGKLDPRWNQASHIYNFPAWDRSMFDQKMFDALRGDPWIVHFTTRDKPWKGMCPHPHTAEFFECLDRTAWVGYRPPLHQLLREFYRVQERRLRQGRRWLVNRAKSWLRPETARRAA